MNKILVTLVVAAVLALVGLTVAKEIKKETSGSISAASLLLQDRGEEKSELYAWGLDDDHQVSGGIAMSSKSAKNTETNSPRLIAEVAPAAMFAGEASAGYIIKDADDKTLGIGWGANEIYQINDTVALTLDDPAAMKLPDKTAAVSSIHRHGLALTQAGDVYAWGYNYSGQLGNNTSDNDGQKTPNRVDRMPKAKAISAGYKFSLAIAEDGTVYGWGAKCANEKYRIVTDFAVGITGAGYYETTVLPRVRATANEDCINEKVVGIQSIHAKQFAGITNVVSISAGYGHGLFLKDDGTVLSFGCNLYGQLGNRQATNVPSNAIPRKIEGLSNITAVAAGFRHSLALTADGRVYMWGGELVQGSNGIEAAKNRELVLLSGLPKIAKIVAGRDYSLAISEDGKLYGWGSNATHQLSADSAEFYKNPIQIVLPGIVTDVAAGQSFVLASVVN